MARGRQLGIVALVALGLAAGGPAGAACGAKTPWTTFGGDDARSGENRCEDVLGPGNVAGLQLLWSANFTSVSIAQPTYAPDLMIDGVSHDVLFVADEHGVVQALDAATGAQLWQQSFGVRRNDCLDIPDGVWGVSGAPVLDLATHTGYLATAKDQVIKIDLATGRKVKGWKPLSVGKSKLDHVYGALTLANGRLYATTASYCDEGKYYGHVTEIDVAADKVVARWDVVPKSTGSYGGGIWGPGGVSVDDANGAVYAATGNSLPGEHDGFAEQVVRLDASLAPQAANYTPLVGADVDYGATPLLFHPPGCPDLLAAKNKSGVLTLYDRDHIANGPLQTLQLADQASEWFNGIPAYSTDENQVYVSNSSDSSVGVFQHGLVAFDIADDCTLTLAWQRTQGANDTSVSPPSVANGVVYWGDGQGMKVFAVAAADGTPLWDSGTTIGGPTFAAPLIADGRLIEATWDGHVYAFGLVP